MIKLTRIVAAAILGLGFTICASAAQDASNDAAQQPAAQAQAQTQDQAAAAQNQTLPAKKLTHAAKKEHHARAAQKASQQPVNINTADAKQLASLKGIGKKKAEAIVAYREKNGNFNAVEELAKVKGINEKIISANRARITLG